MSTFLKILKNNHAKDAMCKHILASEIDAVPRDYIQGLVFLAIADDNFHEDERSYIEDMIKYMELPEDILEVAEVFIDEPDEEMFLKWIARLRLFETETKISFLLDVSMIAFKDGNFDEIELEHFDEYVEILGLHSHRQNILLLSEILHTQNIDNAISFYTAQRDFYDMFEYMFEFLNIDIQKEINKIFNCTWKTISYGDEKIRMSSQAVSKREFSIFLNSMIMNGRLKQINDSKYFELDEEPIVENIENINLTFSNFIFKYENEKHDFILGFGALAIKEYIEWVNSIYEDCEVELVSVLEKNDSRYVIHGEVEPEYYEIVDRNGTLHLLESDDDCRYPFASNLSILPKSTFRLMKK